MSISSLSVALSGLNAAQAGIRTTQHNISNINTSGYRRQEVAYTTPSAQFTSSGYFGSGTAIESVRQIYSQFLDNAVLQNQGQLSYYETYSAQASQIDSMLGDSNSGLSKAISKFFSASSEVANDPTSTAARQNLLSMGKNLAGRINTLDTQMQGMLDASNTAVTSMTQEINVLTTGIASLNASIAKLEGGSGQTANDLRDQRDALVANLNKLVQVTQVQQPDGEISLYIGEGQTLVQGKYAYSVSAVTDSNDSSLKQAVLNIGGMSLPLSGTQIKGGELAGLLAQRDEVLLPAMSDVTAMAFALSSEINAIHRNGLQQDAATAGGNFFTPAQEQVGGASGWLSLGTSSSGSRIANDNYSASWDGSAFTVVRESDGLSTTVSAGEEVVMDGVAQGFSLYPHTTFVPVAGSGTWNLNFKSLAASMSMILGNTTEVAAAASTANGAGDNRNALALAALRTSRVLNNQQSTFEQAYQQTVTRTANNASNADISVSAYTTLVDESTSSQQGLSGVNLDEEAINLVRFQQAYQASAKAMSVASAIFDELLGVVR